MTGKTFVFAVFCILFGMVGILAIRHNPSTGWNSRDRQERFTNPTTGDQVKESRKAVLRSYFEAADAIDLYCKFYSAYDSDKDVSIHLPESSAFGWSPGDSVGIVRVSAAPVSKQKQ